VSTIYTTFVLGAVFIDTSLFVDAQPTDGEKEMFLEVEAVLKKGQIILSEISQYRGASKEIREVCFSFLSTSTGFIALFILDFQLY
jgi:hypothetical protein